jgi:formylglycine-generating enzyme required for sulfatase activity
MSGSLVLAPAVAAPKMPCVPAGSFAMGCATGRPDEQPVHDADVRSFLFAATPVTHGQYAPFVATGRVPAPPWWSHPAFADDDQPVVGVTWPEAVAFAGWLSEILGGLWRLPTEAEWERAARGGLPGAPTTWGEVVPADEIPGGPLDGPWRVGRGTPNGYGLLDIGTLVHEWCSDWYAADYYAASPRNDPQGPPEGERRASRGGSWRHHVRWSPPSGRSSLPPDYRYADYGFRVAREVP